MESVNGEGKVRGSIDPEKGLWAPMVWQFLHGIVEWSGRCGIGATLSGGRGWQGSLAVDEARELYWILQNMETIIPCAKCRVHCIEYKKLNPLSKSGAFLFQKSLVIDWNKELLREYLWKFHEAVNARLNKPAGPPIESIAEIYSKISIKDIWKNIWNEIFPSVGVAGGLDAEKMRDFNRHVQLWKGFACL